MSASSTSEASRTSIFSRQDGVSSAGIFLTPYYDITFSASARGDDTYKRRRKADRYEDFRKLPDETADEVLFLGGKDYVPLFCKLSAGIKSKRTVFYSSAHPPDAPGCVLAKFETTTRTNWHYECANWSITRNWG